MIVVLVCLLHRLSSGFRINKTDFIVLFGVFSAFQPQSLFTFNMWKEVASAFFRNSCFVLHRSQMHLKLVWRQVNDDTVFILGWTTPLRLLGEDVCFLWTFQVPDKTPDKMQMYCFSLLWGLIAVWVTKGGAGKNRGPAFCICIRKPHPKDSFSFPVFSFLFLYPKAIVISVERNLPTAV